MTSVASARAGRRAGSRRRGSLRGWLAARGLTILSALLQRLPDGLLVRGAGIVGGLLYRLQPARRRLVQANLERVARYLVEHGLANEATAAAARDGRALDRLVRSAFSHYVRGYLELATLPRYATDAALARVSADDPELAGAAFPDVPQGRHEALIIIGLHFGAIEIPALWATRRGLRITAPMETIADAHLQAYMERTRSATGLRVIAADRAAAADLRATLGRGETIALVADRAVTGGGARVELFGAPARLPAGPAVLALESGAPAWLVATRRVSGGYRSRLERIEAPASGAMRERLNGFMAAQARAFERAVADAPEQWWTLFFQVWDDIPARGRG